MKLKKSDYQILEDKSVLRWKIFDVNKIKVKLPTGNVAEWAYVAGPDVVGGVVLTQKNTVILKKEFRAAAKDLTLEIPAGSTEAKNEKERVKELNRELQEEIGLKGRKIEKLMSSFTNAHNSRAYHVYLVRDLKKSKLKQDEDELIETVELPFSRALKEVLSGKQPTTYFTIAGLLLAKNRLGL